MEQNERTSMVNDNTNMTISSEAMAITSFFVSSSLFTREQKYLSLIVSLYARRENANKEVLDILSPFVADLEETFSKLDNFFGKRGWKETVSSEYDSIIRYCYKEMMKAAIPFNRHETINIPKELVELCVKSVDCNKVANIFLPYAGNCEFAYYLDRCYCDGFEPSQKTWAIQQIILDAYQMNANIIRSSSSAPTFNKDSKKYDFIFTLPPHIYGAGGIAMIPTFTSMLEHALNDGGAMCMIIPTAITVSRPWKAFRQQLIDKSDIYSLASVSLPKQTISQSTVDMCLLVIQKNGDNNGMVLMINGNHPDMYILDKVSHRVSLKVDSILESVEKYDERIARVIPFAELGEDILLTADRYFADEGMRDAKEGEKLTNIADLIEIIPPLPRDTNLTKGGVIGMRELSDNYLTSEIDLSTIREEDTNSTHVFAKATECLAGFIGGRFKVGYFPEECNNKCILLRREIIQFRLRQGSGISRDYLFRELMSDYVQRQAERLSKGAAITRISKEDFLSLRIYVPSKEQQDSLVFSDGLAGMSAEDRERIKALADFRKDIHMKKHAIGQTVFNLGNWLNNLKYARQASNGIIDESAEIGGLVKIKVSDIFDNIDAAMKILSHQIRTFDVSYGMESENFSLADFLDEYLKSHQHSQVYFDFDSGFDRYDDTPLTYIEFPKDALVIILDNIISNAVAHGFTDKDKEYTIRFRFESFGSKVVLSISNNGKPLPEGKDPENIFVYGETTGDTRAHFGIGGYQVKNLMKEFDGDANIKSTPDEEFTVTYNLIFGKTNIVDLDIE